MRLVARAFALVLTGAAAASAWAVFDAAPFASLRAELERARDEDFGGDLDRAAKKRQSAVLASLARLDRAADEVLDDVGTGGYVVARLSGPYRDQAATFDPLFEAMADGLAATIQADLDALAARVPSLSAKAQRTVQRKVDAATNALAAANDEARSFKARIAKLRVAALAVKSGTKTADRPAPGGAKGTNATVDGAAWRSKFAQSEYNTGDGALQVYATRDVPGGGSEAIYLLVKGVFGPGTYPLTAADARGNFQVYAPGSLATIYPLVPDSGSIVVEILDTDASPRVKLTFSYTATHASAGTKTITGGTHDVTEVDVRPGDGF